MVREKMWGRGHAPLRVRVLRKARWLHALIGLPLLVLVVVSSVTGIVLGWKKNVDALQPPTQAARHTDLSDWLPLHRLASAASEAMEAEVGREDPARLVPERLDVRPDDGVVKILFPGTWEVQVEGATARVRSVARRHSDWIETIHDGSIISDGFKLLAMNGLGLGLLALAVSGFWMWYGPRRLRRARTREDAPAPVVERIG